MFRWWWQVSESPSELRVVGRGEAGDGLLQGNGAQHDGELHHEVEGGAGGVDMEVQPVMYCTVMYCNVRYCTVLYCNVM